MTRESTAGIERPVRKRVSAASRLRKLALAGAVIVAVGALAACSSTSAGSGSSSSGSSTTVYTPTKSSAATLKAGYEGVTFPMPKSGPVAQKGKTVWVLNCSAFAACTNLATGFQAAGAKLGWDVKVFDNKSDPNATINLMKQAVAAKADAIVEYPLDCSTIKAGVVAATAANIPVLGPLGLDCNYTGFGKPTSGPGVFTAQVAINGTNGPAELMANYGKSDADMLIASAQKAGITKPKIIDFQLIDQQFHLAAKEGFDAEIKAKCPGCVLVPADFTVPILVNQPQFFKNKLVSNPDANIMYIPFDAAIGAGVSAALASNTSIKLVVGGDGDKTGVDYVRSSSKNVVINVYDYAFTGWASADVLNRLFAGDKVADLPNEGGYNLYLNKTTNMPAAGGEVKAPIDYEKTFASLWSTGKA
jgi:ribose transport system substrate-binding protein